MLNHVKLMTVRDMSSTLLAGCSSHNFLYETNSDMNEDSYWTMEELMKNGFQPSSGTSPTLSGSSFNSH